MLLAWWSFPFLFLVPVQSPLLLVSPPTHSTISNLKGNQKQTNVFTNVHLTRHQKNRSTMVKPPWNPRQFTWWTWTWQNHAKQQSALTCSKYIHITLNPRKGPWHKLFSRKGRAKQLRSHGHRLSMNRNSQPHNRYSQFQKRDTSPPKKEPCGKANKLLYFKWSPPSQKYCHTCLPWLPWFWYIFWHSFRHIFLEGKSGEDTSDEI